MLIRKLRQKYIDDNEAFSQILVGGGSIEALDTQALLQQNFKVNGSGRGSTASNLSFSKVGNAQHRVGNSINTLPRIRNNSYALTTDQDMYSPSSRRSGRQSSGNVAPLMRKSL